MGRITLNGLSTTMSGADDPPRTPPVLASSLGISTFAAIATTQNSEVGNSFQRDPMVSPCQEIHGDVSLPVNVPRAPGIAFDEEVAGDGIQGSASRGVLQQAEADENARAQDDEEISRNAAYLEDMSAPKSTTEASATSQLSVLAGATLNTALHPADPAVSEGNDEIITATSPAAEVTADSHRHEVTSAHSLPIEERDRCSSRSSRELMAKPDPMIRKRVKVFYSSEKEPSIVTGWYSGTVVHVQFGMRKVKFDDGSVHVLELSSSDQVDHDSFNPVPEKSWQLIHEEVLRVVLHVSSLIQFLA